MVTLNYPETWLETLWQVTFAQTFHKYKHFQESKRF